MKKLSLILVLVFVGCIAMAQQVSIVGSNGIGNTATVTQAGADGNYSNVNLVGNTNTGTVDQWNGGFAGDKHEAWIDVTGNSNVASIQQIRAAGDAIITQKGNGNDAAIVENGNFVLPAGFDAYAYQEGNSNDIVMNIFGTNSIGYAYQLGNTNNIVQSLGQDVGQKVENSSVYASQIGDGNTILQTTEGEGFAGGITAIGEVERAEQTGNGNWAQQTQYDDLLPASNNYERVIQTGNGNASIQNQAGQSNTSLVLQNGLDNSTTVQIGSGNTATVNQW